MSLLDKTCAKTAVPDSAFPYLFGWGSARPYLINASQLSLPATTLGIDCYMGMFNQQQYMTNTPTVLPAPVLKTRCYMTMFRSGRNQGHLLTVPRILATSIEKGADKCMYSMFERWAQIDQIPAINISNFGLATCALIFRQAAGLKFSETQTEECPNAFRFGNGSSIMTESNSFGDAFAGTGGTYTSDPTVNTVYYTNATVID